MEHYTVLFFAILGLCLATAPSIMADMEHGSDATLYNGIRLPSTWPPRAQVLTNELMPVPYLEAPPEVVPIDVGRQLFVDDFLVQETTLKRTYHLAEYYQANPVLKPDKPWEQEGGPTAMVFSDGVWWDPKDQLFKMWYMAGYVKGTAYATSKDGIRWDKPELDVKPGTNLVHLVNRDSGTVWLDLEEKNPARRFKLFIFPYPEDTGALNVYFSPDGIHWSERAVRSGPTGDRATVFYNPFRKVWVYGVRGDFGTLGRIRLYHEDPDAIAAAQWKDGEPVLWVGADKLDPIREDLKTPCQLYNLDCVAYESIMLGLFSIWRGQPDGRAKPNEVCIGFSRDGFHWGRPDRCPFVPVSENYGDWNWGNVQSAGGCCLVVGDKLYFYVSGRAGVKGSRASGVSSTGLAVLRRDGFASMDSGETEGTLTTRPVQFSGKYLFVNAAMASGELRCDILDTDERVIAPFSCDHCVSIKADTTIQLVKWKGARSLSKLIGKPVRFRFHVRKGSLFAFWVSPDNSGASYGFVAGGGPRFLGPTDTVGASAVTAP